MGLVFFKINLTGLLILISLNWLNIKTDLITLCFTTYDKTF